jgi:hypothetical protein
VQVGDTNTPNIKLIFIAGNECYNNAQTGLWLKNCYDVILSTNHVHDHIDDPSGAGGEYMLGGQYDFGNAWWINNELSGAGSGMMIASSNGTQAAGARYFIGNLLHDITSVSYDPNNSHSPAAISDRNSTNAMIVVNNTVWNCHAGYASPYANRTVVGNIFGAANFSGAAQMFLYSGSGHTVNYNKYQGAATVKYNGTTLGGYSLLTGAGLEASGSQNANITFVNSGAGDYTPASGSDAIDAAGTIQAAYSAFQSRYGFTIWTGRNGVDRPLSGLVDCGAYERAAA